MKLIHLAQQHSLTTLLMSMNEQINTIREYLKLERTGHLNRITWSSSSVKDLMETFIKSFKKTVLSQYKIASYIQKHPNYPVMQEGVVATSMAGLEKLEKNRIINHFGQGIPENSSLLTDTQQELLYIHGGAIISLCLGVIKRVYPASHSYIDNVNAIQYPSINVADPIGYFHVVELRENETILCAQEITLDLNPEAIILIYGAAHDFSRHCKRNDYEYIRINMCSDADALLVEENRSICKVMSEHPEVVRLREQQRQEEIKSEERAIQDKLNNRRNRLESHYKPLLLSLQKEIDLHCLESTAKLTTASVLLSKLKCFQEAYITESTVSTEEFTSNSKEAIIEALTIDKDNEPHFIINHLLNQLLFHLCKLLYSCTGLSFFKIPLDNEIHLIETTIDHMMADPQHFRLF